MTCRKSARHRAWSAPSEVGTMSSGAKPPFPRGLIRDGCYCLSDRLCLRMAWLALLLFRWAGLKAERRITTPWRTLALGLWKLRLEVLTHPSSRRLKVERLNFLSPTDELRNTVTLQPGSYLRPRILCFLNSIRSRGQQRCDQSISQYRCCRKHCPYQDSFECPPQPPLMFNRDQGS